MTPTYRLPRWLPRYVLAVVVLVLLAFALGCKATGNTLARWGGAATGALAGGAVAGPAGAAVGAVAGDAGGDALVADPPQTVNETTIENHGGTVNVASAKAEPRAWYWNPWYWILAYGVFRFRAGILAFARSLATGGIKAALLTLGGLVWGGRVADTAKEAVAEHESMSPMARRLRRRPPTTTIVSQEVKPHAQ